MALEAPRYVFCDTFRSRRLSSVGPPLLTGHLALWSSDFPHGAQGATQLPDLQCYNIENLTNDQESKMVHRRTVRHLHFDSFFRVDSIVCKLVRFCIEVAGNMLQLKLERDIVKDLRHFLMEFLELLVLHFVLFV